MILHLHCPSPLGATEMLTLLCRPHSVGKSKWRKPRQSHRAQCKLFAGGLGSKWSWTAVLEGERAQLVLQALSPTQPLHCFSRDQVWQQGEAHRDTLRTHLHKRPVHQSCLKGKQIICYSYRFQPPRSVFSHIQWWLNHIWIKLIKAVQLQKELLNLEVAILNFYSSSWASVLWVCQTHYSNSF